MRVNAVFLTAAILALSACETASQDGADAANAGRDCFRAEQASGYSIIDEHNIRVNVGPSRSYTLHTTWNANNLDWTSSLALRSDSGWICTGRVLGSVEVTGGTPRQSFPISSVTRDPPPPGQEGS